jgi:hypothetical protein
MENISHQLAVAKQPPKDVTCEGWSTRVLARCVLKRSGTTGPVFFLYNGNIVNIPPHG